MDESEVRRIEEAERIQAEPWRRVLLDAADYIAEHGLSCGGGVDQLGRPCTIHAIGKVSFYVDFSDDANRTYDAAIDRVARYLFAAGKPSVPVWSDSTPAAEVVETLRSVARA